jgi:hypothetical protein
METIASKQAFFYKTNNFFHFLDESTYVPDAVAQWHRIRLRKKRPQVRITPGIKFCNYISLQLFLNRFV